MEPDQYISAERAYHYVFNNPRKLITSIEENICQYLDLSANNRDIHYWILFEEGKLLVGGLFPLIQQSSSLVDLSLHGNRLGDSNLQDKTFDALCLALGNNTSLTQLDLSENFLDQLPTTKLTQLLQALDNNTSLQYINLSDNLLEKKQAELPTHINEKWKAYCQLHSEPFCFTLPDLSLKTLFFDVQCIRAGTTTLSPQQIEEKAQNCVLEAIKKEKSRLTFDSVHSQLLLTEYFLQYDEICNNINDHNNAIIDALKYLMRTPYKPFYSIRNNQIDNLFKRLERRIKETPVIELKDYLDAADTTHQYYPRLLRLLGLNLMSKIPPSNEPPKEKLERLALIICLLNVKQKTETTYMPLIPLFYEAIGLKGPANENDLLKQKKLQPEKFTVFQTILSEQQQKYNLPIESISFGFLNNSDEKKSTADIDHAPSLTSLTYFPEIKIT